jgi:autotransporter-associated beta strand protein
MMVPLSAHAVGTWTAEAGNNDLTNWSNWSSFAAPAGNSENGSVHGGLIFDGSFPSTSSTGLWAPTLSIAGGLIYRNGVPPLTIAADTTFFSGVSNSPILMTPDCTSSQTIAVGSTLGDGIGGLGVAVNNSPAALNVAADYAANLGVDGSGNAEIGSTSVGPGVNIWCVANGSVTAAPGVALKFVKGGVGQVTLDNPNGMADAGNSQFNFFCGASIVRTIAGAPLGTGNVLLAAGTLNIAPLGNSANIALPGGSMGKSFQYGAAGNNFGGAVVSLNTGNNHSVTYNFTGNLVRNSQGTLVIVPAGTTTGTSGGTLGLNENWTFSAAPTPTNGILSPSIVAQVSSFDTTGHFVTYGLVGYTGFSSAQSAYTTWAGGVYAPAATEISDITGNCNTAGPATTYALRVGATLQLGGALTINSGGLIDNGDYINFGSLVFKNGGGMPIEALFYAGGSGTSVINSAISTASGLTKFGAGTLRLAQPNSYTGPTVINQGVLQLGNGSALPPGQNVNVCGSTSVLDLNGWTTAFLGTVSLDGYGQIMDNSYLMGFPGGTIRAAAYSFTAGTVGSTTAGPGGLNLALADAAAPAKVTIESPDVSAYSTTNVILRGNNTYSGGTEISSSGILNVAYDVNLGSTATPLAKTVLIDERGVFQLNSNVDFSATRTLKFNGAGASNYSIIDTNGFNVTFTSPIGGGGAGGLLKRGKGTLLLHGNNSLTFFGDTVISGGVLDVNSDSNLGAANPQRKLIFSQDLDPLHSGRTPVFRFGSGWAGFDPSLTRTICLDNDGGIDTNGNFVSLGGVITDDGNGTYCGRLIKMGAGTLTLSGANLFGGGLWVQQGTAQVGNIQALGTTRVIAGYTTYPQVTVDSGGTLDLNGFSMHLGGIRGQGTVTDSFPSLAVTITDTVANPSDIVFFSGNIVQQFLGQAITLIKNGGGTQVLSGSSNYSGNTLISGGVLRADVGLAIPGTAAGVPYGNIQLNGGAWETTSDINLNLGAAAGQVQLPAGNSGFSAYGSGAALNVTLNGGASLVWGVTPSFNPDALVLQGPWANRSLAFSNPLDLNGNDRIVEVDADPTAPYYDPRWTIIYPNVVPATLLGKISNSAAQPAGLIKKGNGILVLANSNNSYSGQTQINGGVLRAVDGLSLPAASNLNITSGVLETSGTFNRGFGAGAGQVQLNSPGGVVGFSAFNGGPGTTVIDINQPTPLKWNSDFFTGTLRLNDASADSHLLVLNSIDLDERNNSDTHIIDVRAVPDDVHRATISGAIINSPVIPPCGIVKTGQGILELTGTNTYNYPTVVLGGILRATDGVGLVSSEALVLKGGVFETGADFFRPLGAGPDGWVVSCSADMPTIGLQYPSGFSAYSPSGGLVSGALTVAIGGAGAPTALTWDPNGLFCPNPLILNAQTANAPLFFLNPINLNDLTRQINVNSPTEPATMSGVLSGGDGGGSLIKSGPGRLILTASNTYLGDTTIAGGTLQLGDSATHNGSVAGNIVDNAALVFANPAPQTYLWTISGSGTVTKVAVGKETLGGNNTYTGGTAINGGTLSVADFGALGTVGNISFGGGVLQFTASNTDDYSSRIKTSSGTIALDTNGQTVLFAGSLDASNTDGLWKLGDGMLTLAAINTYGGGTTVTRGTLVATSPSSIPDGSAVTVGNGGFFLGPIVVAGSEAAPAAVPEPATWALLLTAAMLTQWCRRHSRRCRAACVLPAN